MKKIFIVISLSLGMLLLNQACTNNVQEFVGPNRDQDQVIEQIQTRLDSQFNIKKISREELPEGIVPLEVKNEDELNVYLQKFEKISITPIVNKNKRLLVKNRSEGPGSHSHVVSSDGYDILIILAWEKRGSGSISVTSTNAETWFFTAWEQTSGVASWDGPNTINYNVTGLLKFYVGIGDNIIEFSRTAVTLEGSVGV